MRDAKDGNAMVQIDVGLLNLMYAMQEWARQSGRSNPVITINSAYRTPRRNATLRVLPETHFICAVKQLTLL